MGYFAISSMQNYKNSLANCNYFLFFCFFYLFFTIFAPIISD